MNKTGMAGIYTFILGFSGGGGAARSAGAGNSFQARDPRGPSVFEAVQRLGMRLERTASVPVEVIWVESVDKVPTAN